MSQLISCPHCATTVRPSADGECPACRGNLFDKTPRPEAPASFTAAEPVEPTPGWAQYHVFRDDTTPDNAGERPANVPESTALAVAQFGGALAEFTPRVVVTPAIVAINIMVILVMALTGANPLAPSVQSVLAWGANFGPKTMHGEWWRLFTSMFLHFGVIHLGFNMWVLWDAGKLMERLVGNVGFAILYVTSGLMGSLASLAWRPTVVSAGASGAVFGVVGALLGVLALRRDTVPAVVLSHLRNSLTGFLVFNLLFGFVVPGIDMAAHAGGLAAGVVCGLLMSHPLTSEGARRRWRGNAVVLMLSLAVVPASAVLLPPAPQDIESIMQDFVVTEKDLLARYNHLVREHQRQRLTDAHAAQRMANEVLAPWREMRQQIEAAETAPLANSPVIRKLSEYLRAREASFQSLVDALRTGDPEKLRMHREQWDAAERLVREFASKGT